jgi:hypothetical protein
MGLDASTRTRYHFVRLMAKRRPLWRQWKIAGLSVLMLAVIAVIGVGVRSHRSRFGLVRWPDGEVEALAVNAAERALADRPWRTWMAADLFGDASHAPGSARAVPIGVLAWSVDCWTSIGASQPHCVMWGPHWCADGLQTRSDTFGVTWAYRCLNGDNIGIVRASLFSSFALLPTLVLLMGALTSAGLARRWEPGRTVSWRRATRASATRVRLDDGHLAAVGDTAPPGQTLEVITAGTVEGGYREGDLLRVLAARPALPNDADGSDRSRRAWRMVFVFAASALVDLVTTVYLLGFMG